MRYELRIPVLLFSSVNGAGRHWPDIYDQVRLGWVWMLWIRIQDAASCSWRGWWWWWQWCWWWKTMIHCFHEPHPVRNLRDVITDTEQQTDLSALSQIVYWGMQSPALSVGKLANNKDPGKWDKQLKHCASFKSNVYLSHSLLLLSKMENMPLIWRLASFNVKFFVFTCTILQVLVCLCNTPDTSSGVVRLHYSPLRYPLT